MITKLVLHYMTIWYAMWIIVGVIAGTLAFFWKSNAERQSDAKQLWGSHDRKSTVASYLLEGVFGGMLLGCYVGTIIATSIALILVLMWCIQHPVLQL